MSFENLFWQKIKTKVQSPFLDSEFIISNPLNIASIIQVILTEWIQSTPDYNFLSTYDCEELVELISDHIALIINHKNRNVEDIARNLRKEVIRRRLSRYSTECYQVDQQLAANISVNQTKISQLEQYGKDLATQITEMQLGGIPCDDLKALLQQTYNGNFYLFGMQHLSL
jgi:hypothetical protein